MRNSYFRISFAPALVSATDTTTQTTDLVAVGKGQSKSPALPLDHERSRHRHRPRRTGWRQNPFRVWPNDHAPEARNGGLVVDDLITPKRLITADAYDAHSLRDWLKSHRMIATIPSSITRKVLYKHSLIGFLQGACPSNFLDGGSGGMIHSAHGQGVSRVGRRSGLAAAALAARVRAAWAHGAPRPRYGTRGAAILPRCRGHREIISRSSRLARA